MELWTLRKKRTPGRGVPCVEKIVVEQVQVEREGLAVRLTV